MSLIEVGWGSTIPADHAQASQWREQHGVEQPPDTGDSALRTQAQGISDRQESSRHFPRRRAPRQEAVDPGVADSSWSEG